MLASAFQLLGLAPTNHHVTVFEAQPTWNYTTFLDIAFLVLMAVMAWRFMTTGGIEMLDSGSGNTVQGNFIGTDRTGTPAALSSRTGTARRPRA